MEQAKIRVIHSFPVWLPQTQTWMYNQVKYLPGEVEVHVVCERTTNLDQFAIPNIHSLVEISRLQYLWERLLRKVKMPRLLRFLQTTIRNLNAQIVHSHFGDTGWTNMDSVQRSGARHVVTFYGYDVGMLPARHHKWLTRYRELFDQANLFLCEGPVMANRLIGLGCRPEKIRVHHLGVEVEKIEYRPRTWQKGEPLRILMAAGFREKKGFTYALKALSEFQHDVPIEITIIGDASSEPRSQQEKIRILNNIEDGNLKSITTMLGFRSHAVFFEEAYKHHVFLSPSVTASDGDTEGGAPVSIIEMMATGMPVISTAHCDIPEVVSYGIPNWLVEERDVSGLVDRLNWLIENWDRWDMFLKTGREHIEREFNAIRQGEQLANYYSETLSGTQENREINL